MPDPKEAITPDESRQFFEKYIENSDGRYPQHEVQAHIGIQLYYLGSGLAMIGQVLSALIETGEVDPVTDSTDNHA